MFSIVRNQVWDTDFVWSSGARQGHLPHPTLQSSSTRETHATVLPATLGEHRLRAQVATECHTSSLISVSSLPFQWE